MDGERMTAGGKPEWQQPSEENRDGAGAVDLQGVMQGRRWQKAGQGFKSRTQMEGDLWHASDTAVRALKVRKQLWWWRLQGYF